MKSETVILWFRRDFRLEDNVALESALEAGRVVIPVFIWCPDEESPWQPIGAGRVWLHHSLEALDAALRKKGNRLLILKEQNYFDALVKLATEHKVGQIFANSIYEPIWLDKDKKLAHKLSKQDISLEVSPGMLLYDPFAIKTAQGNPFQVFTPYWRACLQRDSAPGNPIAAPAKIPALSHPPAGANLKDLNLLPKIKWDGGIVETWTPGLDGAKTALDLFIDNALRNYAETRNLPYEVGTSRLSPYLHFGEISPRRVWQEVSEHLQSTHALRRDSAKINGMKATNSGEVYLRELGWREFAHQVLCNFPNTPTKPLREDFAHFPFRKDPDALKAWRKGQTGYPIVDAGMRELWHTGWMHNRVRMIVASFLVKHLLLPWQDGARWFWDTLVDADLANNTMGWQWSAGCGADAAPYFRIFNPILQGEKFDPQGTYVRKWVPELAKLPDEFIHQPWEAPSLILHASKITLDENYPAPIVEHTKARQRALGALSKVRGKEL
jgi:deoxyribodipyrimidine photo-lyase